MTAPASMKHFFPYCTALVLGAIAIPAICREPEPIRFAVNTYWIPPYGEIQQQRLVGGILYDLAQALGNATHRAIVQVPLPRKRMEIAASEGKYDIHCFFNPAWSEMPSQYVWSNPLFEESSVMIGHVSAAPVHAPSELPRGTVVNTVLGNKEDIDALFASGQLVRDDSSSELLALQKTAAGHNKYGVVHQLMAQWFPEKQSECKPGPLANRDLKK